MEREYPEYFLRGILNKDYLIDGLPASNLFENFKENVNREKDCQNAELSINWYDCEFALEQMLGQMTETDNNVVRYKAGVGVFSRAKLDKLCKRNPYCVGILSYERDEIKVIGEENPHHGNLLLLKEVAMGKDGKRKRAMISALLAGTCCVKVVPSNQ